MGHNPLVTKLENVVRLLTHAMRYQTVKHMIENGRGEELYEAHAELTNILKTRKRENLNEAVRKTYFDQVPQA